MTRIRRPGLYQVPNHRLSPGERVVLARMRARLGIEAGGPGSGCRGDNCGRPGGSHTETPAKERKQAIPLQTPGKTAKPTATNPVQEQQAPVSTLSKSERAKLAYTAANYEEQKIADYTEHVLSQQLGLSRTANNSPFDLVGPKVGVEVKTLIKSKNSKITMKADAIARKMKQARKDKLKIHTVVVEKRPGQPEAYYHAKGVGSFRVASMKRYDSVDGLKKVLGLAESR